MRTAILGLVLLAAPALADSITVDEILYPESTVTDPSVYAGTVDMTYDSGTKVLTIVLTNTSTGSAGPQGADNLLTGIGFNLPDGLSIVGGSANMTGSSAIGFSFPSGGDVSEEWGFDTPDLDSGALLDLATGTYNAAASSMESQTTNQFQAGSIASPPNLDGPDFGLLSKALSGAVLGSGVEGIQDSLTITLQLSGNFGGDLLSFIERHDVALTFGSPNAGRDNVVPEPGSWALVCGALGAGWFWRRRRSA